MIVAARWVIPVSGPPIRDGAVRIDDARIVEVGARDELAAAHPAEEVRDYPACALVPGLVNAHTHLALSVLRDVVPSSRFPEWIGRTARAIKALTPDDLVASATLGAHRAIASGTTAVGDIVYAPETAAVATEAGLSGAFFWEVLGVERDELGVRLERDGYPAVSTDRDGRVRHGLSAHSPYTAGPGLISALHALAHASETPFAIHIAESPAEDQFVRDGTGPLSDVASRTAPDFEPAGVSPIRYLHGLGVLEDTIAVHCAEASVDDTHLLAEHARGVVLCPRSNAYLHVGPAPVAALDRAGVRLALGTDSLGSNSDLDLFAEARALAGIAPGLSAERIVRIMTLEGASVLGLAEGTGSLAPGAGADLALFRVPDTEDPYAALLQNADRHAIEAVMSEGVWRVLDGQPTSPSHYLSAAVNRAAARAAAAIA